MATSGKNTKKGKLTGRRLSDSEARKKYGNASLIFVGGMRPTSKKK